jgi:plastocyanin
LVLIAAIGGGCTDPTGPPPTPGPNFDFRFPAAGTVTSPGTSNKRVFSADEAGSWDYRCTPHSGSGMTGTIKVVAGSPNESVFVRVGFNGTNEALQFNPAVVTIDTGGYVRWANVSSMTNHTATRP